VRLLIDAGANKEAASDASRAYSKSGCTALMWAARAGRADCVRMLIDAGADKEARTENGHTALMHAAETGHADCARVLIAAGAAKAATSDKGNTALHLASWRRPVCMELVRLLSEGGGR
jgi:ankyrin repeat protein